MGRRKHLCCKHKFKHLHLNLHKGWNRFCAQLIYKGVTKFIYHLQRFNYHVYVFKLSNNY